jgi:hypothetical protein
LRTLCIGNQTYDTDDRTTKLARENNSINHGLITNANIVTDSDGYWHTSLADVEYSVMLQLAQKFDSVYFFDQDGKSDKTLKLYQELEPLVPVICERADMFDHIISKRAYWQEQFKTNPSICVMPFVASGPDICGAISVPVSAQEQETMKHNMIAGIKNSQCESCYIAEGTPQGFQVRKPKNFDSARLTQSLDWIRALNLQTVDGLSELSTAYYYRIKSQELDSVDINKLAHPHICVDIVDDCTEELLYFLERCVQAEITQFKLTFSSNELNKQLLDILNNFSSVNVETILKVSMNNIDTLDELLEFSDKISISTGIESPYNFPNKKQILEVLDRCKQTKKYKTCVYTQGTIDTLYKNFYVYHYQKYTRRFI